MKRPGRGIRNYAAGQKIMAENKIVIGIGGVSGGGKTRLVAELARTLGNAHAVYFDEFDDTTEHPSDMRKWLASGRDYNAWKAPVLVEHLRALKFCDASEPKDNPNQYIVFDAPLGRAHAASGQYIDLMVFLDTPLDIAMARRLLRGGFEKSIESHLRDYLEWTRDLFLRHIDQVSATADLVLDGTLSPHALVKLIIDEIDLKYQA